MVNYRRADSFAPLPATKQFPVKKVLNWRSVVVILDGVAHFLGRVVSTFKSDQ